MDAGSIPFLSMLKERMAWLNRRQDVLSQNVASVDLPGYKARDLKAPDFEAVLKAATVSRNSASSLAVTNPHHIGFARRSASYETDNAPDVEAGPTGNSVSLEAQMIKVADTQAQFQAAANLYAKAIDMMKTAIGRPGM
jgi:flagellar basal-body rod protein FlgB